MHPTPSASPQVGSNVEFALRFSGRLSSREMGAWERTEDRTQPRPVQIAGGRRGAGVSVLALQQMAGNQAVSKLMRRTPNTAPKPKQRFDDPSFHEVPEGVTPGASALPAGLTTANAASSKIQDGKVGNVDRVLLDGLPGRMGESWGGADRGHISGVGAGKKGHRGRAIAAIPHGMKTDGPLSLVIHLHGMDINGLTGTSGMRETGDRPEDVGDFQIPQQLEAFATKHPSSRVAVLMPLGVTVPGSVDFGIDDWDKYIDEALRQMGLSNEAVRVYFSAHSGGGFTLSSLLSNSMDLKTHRLGGVIAFESFHSADVGRLEKIIEHHLDADLAKLKERPAGSADQLSYLRDDGFRFAAFAGSGGYTANLTKLRKTVLAWFDKHKGELAAATAGKAEILNMLWRNYQVTFDEAGHMAALSAHSHFESMLESIADRGPAAAVKAPTSPPPAPKPAATTTPTPVHAEPTNAPSPAPTAKDHHGPQAVQARSKQRAKPKPKPPALSADQLRQAATDQAALTDAERELIAARDSAEANLTAAKTKITDIDKQRKRHDITTAQATEAKVPLIEQKASAEKAYGAAAKKISKHVKAKVDMEKALVKAFPQHSADPHQALAAWFGDIVPDATFLGHPIEAEGSVCPGVHQELLAKLKAAERDLEAQGKTFTIHSVGGLRPPSPATGGKLPSYHCFGLAIDIDASSNPFVRGDTEPVVMRATLLMKGSEYDPLKAPEKNVAAQFDALEAGSDALRDYFALRGEGAEAKIEAQLAAHPAARAQGDAATWKKTIEDDLARLKPTDTWKHGDPTKGMLSLDKDLVLALTKAGLTWGGMYRRPEDGRDLMHFDWRGGTIQQR